MPMKTKTFFMTLLVLLTVVACAAPSPERVINDQLKTIVNSHNAFVLNLNNLIELEKDVQDKLDIDLNQDNLEIETSELQKIISERETLLEQLVIDYDLLSTDIAELEEIDIIELEKGEAEIININETLNKLTIDTKQFVDMYDGKFELEKTVVDIFLEEKPSIQALEEAVDQVNDQKEALDAKYEVLRVHINSFSEKLSQWYAAQEQDETPVVVEPDENNENNSNNNDNDIVEVPVVETRYTINTNHAIVPIDDANPNIVLLTFDDAPQPEGKSYALSIAKTLKEKGVSAIFFVNGMFLKTDFGKDQLKQIHDMGFVIGNHTTNHPNLSQISLEEVRSEIVETNDLIEEVIGERPVFFRPPFGVLGEHARTVLDEENMITMNWTYGYDWESEYMEAESLAEIMVNTEYLYNGANLLMHDRRWTSEAIGNIIDGLQAKGYEIVNPLEIGEVQ